MFGKSDQQRIEDTLKVIRTATVPDALYLTGGICGQIGDWVERVYPMIPEARWQALRGLSESMSVRAHIARDTPKGDEHQRGLRRAIVLLWTAIGQQQGVQGDMAPRAAAAMTLQPPQVALAFADVMVKAAVVACNNGAQAVMGDLESHPVRFLKKHRLLVIGTPTGYARFSTTPDNTYQNVMDFNFQYYASAGGKDQFVMAAYAPSIFGAANPFKTVSIPAVHWSLVPNAGAHPCISTALSAVS